MGAFKLYLMKRDKALLQAQEKYEGRVAEQQQSGTLLTKQALSKKIEEEVDEYVIDNAHFNKYLAPDGYVFNLNNLTRVKRFGVGEKETLFTPTRNRFGPVEIASWKSKVKPAILTNPSDRMIAAIVLRNLEGWREQLDPLNDAVFDLTNAKSKTVALGLTKLRTLEQTEKIAVFDKIKQYFNANCTYGRLQLKKSRNNRPYDTAVDLLALIDTMLIEAVEIDEIKLIDALEKIVYTYVHHLRIHSTAPDKLKKIQNKLSEIDTLNTFYLNVVATHRDSFKKSTEISLENLKRADREDIQIFESRNVIDNQGYWDAANYIFRVTEFLNYDPKAEEKREEYSKDIVIEMDVFRSEELPKIDINIDAQKEIKKLISKAKEPMYDYLDRRLDRDKLNIYIAVSRFQAREKKLPESVDSLVSKDIPYFPLNPLTEEPYIGDFVLVEESPSKPIIKGFELDLPWIYLEKSKK